MPGLLLGLMDQITTVVPTEIKWGAKIQGSTSDTETALDSLGLKYVRPGAIQMKNYSSSMTTELTTLYNAGYKCIQTVVWESSNPAAFPTGANLTTFQNNLDTFLTNYGSKIEVLVIENEPTNRTFYDHVNYTINDYLAELSAAVTIANNHQVPVTDGCTHIPYLQDVMNNNVSGDNEEDVQTIVDAIDSIPVTYINVHIAVHDDTLSANLLSDVTSWYSNLVGHPIMSNEFHLADCSSSFIYTVVNEWKKTPVKYCLIFDEDISKNNGGNITDGHGALTTLGNNYADAVE